MSDTKTFRVQVTSVNTNAIIQGKKGPYSGLEFKYVQNGEQKSKAIHNAFFDKSKSLIDALTSFSAGDTVEITVGGPPFFGLESAKKVEATSEELPQSSAATSESKKSYTKSTFVDNSVGMQVGNALTNAATLMTTKAYQGISFEDIAIDVLKLGESLKARLVAGEFSAETKASVLAAPKAVPLKKCTPSKAPAPEPEEDDDMDDPFGD
jgi:hypothetical protein